MVFSSGDSEEVVVVSIVDDTEPELGETFCVSLILPEGNVAIGDTPECMHPHTNTLQHSFIVFTLSSQLV